MRWLACVILLCGGACGIDDSQVSSAPTCVFHGDGIDTCGTAHTQDLMKVHPMATTDNIRDYLLNKKSLSKKSPFRTVNESGKGDMNDLLRGLTLVKRAYGINPLFALALSAVESKWGISSIGQTKYNLWGWNAADGRTHQASKFTSYTEGFNRVFQDIKTWYLKPSGRFHKSCNPPEYFRHYVRRGGCAPQDCGASLAGMNCKYSRDPKWANKIRSLMNQMAHVINSRCDRIRAPDFIPPTLELPRFPHQTNTGFLLLLAKNSCGSVVLPKIKQ